MRVSANGGGSRRPEHRGPATGPRWHIISHTFKLRRVPLVSSVEPPKAVVLGGRLSVAACLAQPLNISHAQPLSALRQRHDVVQMHKLAVQCCPTPHANCWHPLRIPFAKSPPGVIVSARCGRGTWAHRRRESQAVGQWLAGHARSFPFASALQPGRLRRVRVGAVGPGAWQLCARRPHSVDHVAAFAPHSTCEQVSLDAPIAGAAKVVPPM